MGWTRNYHTYYFMPVPPINDNCNASEGSSEGGGVNEPVMDGRVQTTRRGDSNHQFDLLVQGDDYRGGTNNKHRIHYLQADTTASGKSTLVLFCYVLWCVCLCKPHVLIFVAIISLSSHKL